MKQIFPVHTHRLHYSLRQGMDRVLPWVTVLFPVAGVVDGTGTWGEVFLHQPRYLPRRQPFPVVQVPTYGE